MIKLCIKSTIALIIIFISYIFISYLNVYSAYHDRYDYRDFIIYRYDLLKNTKSPKLICIGGSNLAYGLDSELLHYAFKLPVINMGVHAGVGLNFMLQSVKPYINEGDIVVISPEYEHFFGEEFYGNIPLVDILFLYPYGWKFIDLTNIKQIKAMLICNSWRPISINLFKKHGQPMKNANNKYGDIINHIKAQPVRPLYYNKINSDSFNVATIAGIKEFSEHIKNKRAKLVYDYPPIVKYKYIEERKQVDRVGSVVADLPGIFLSDNPGMNVYSEDYFYDSVYHLNAVGRKLRTEKLIKKIRRMLAD